MFDSLSNSILGGQLSLATMVVNIIVSFVLSLVVAIIYRNTHRGLSYSQSFTFTLVLIGILMAVIITAIGNSLAAAFGVFGAFSIIRFRTAIKDPKDIAFILLVMAIGLTVGVGSYGSAVMVAAIIIGVIYYLNRVNFGSIRKYDYILNFSSRTEDFSNDRLREVFKEFLKEDNLLNVVSRDNGSMLDYSFNVKFFQASDMEKFVSRLNAIAGLQNVDIVSAKNDIEY